MKNKELFWMGVLFALHVIEEYFTEFVKVDRIFIWASRPFIQWGTPIILFTIFQSILWISLIFLFLYAKKYNKIQKYTWIVNIIILFELHHVIEAIIIQQYYSGLITAVMLILGRLLIAIKKT